MKTASWYVRAIIPTTVNPQKAEKLIKKLVKVLQSPKDIDTYSLIVGLGQIDTDTVRVTLEAEEERLLKEEEEMKKQMEKGDE